MSGQIFRPLPALLLCCCLLLGAGRPQAALARNTDMDLVLKDSGGKVLFVCPAREGLTFGIRYIHSVAKSPVEDWFCVTGNVIFLEKTVYQDFGAGLPHNPGPGQTMSMGDGHMVISGYHMALPAFDVRVGRIARHTLLLRDVSAQGGECGLREIPLAELSPPGSAVTFTLEPRSPEKPEAR